ncbi:MAG: potassium transporter Kup [Alphaproteobacteria bacterium]|nr:potassium transporter Kup [Alphaproteobacteria bacterium]
MSLGKPTASDEQTEATESAVSPALALTALGVVYGDIGTSPLYALKQCFNGAHAIAASPENVLGILSLIVWALILIVSIKYLVVILNADNHGEGGIIALVALINPWRSSPKSLRYRLMLLGLFGAALLYGDGAITPAISVLSAVEGLKVATSGFEPYVLPIAVAILVALFVSQRFGTERIGTFFGPVMLVWFGALGLLGIGGIFQAPQVLQAISPHYAAAFLVNNGAIGFILLGTVFLTVTGAETLYADMGHFGRSAIRQAWFVVALPALLLIYFGQGAKILADPASAEHPFYSLVPEAIVYPVILLATTATVIASQAVISGTFSLTRQAIQLGQLPRVAIVQTHREFIGQIYIPIVNWALMFATLWLVLVFRSSTGLGAAYGVGVSTDMVITTILAYFVALRFRWHPVLASFMAVSYLIIDLSFFGANLFKIASGGWFPLLIAGTVFATMSVWRDGVARLDAVKQVDRETMEEFFKRIALEKPQRVPGTAVYMVSSATEVPDLLRYQQEHNHILHERVLLVHVQTEDIPRVPTADRLELKALPENFYSIVLHYGFMQPPNVPVGLKLCSVLGLELDLTATTYFLSHEEIVPMRTAPALSKLATQLFAFLWRNAERATSYYNIPSERVIAFGPRIEL